MNLGWVNVVKVVRSASPISRRQSRRRVAARRVSLPAKSSRFLATGSRGEETFSRGLVELIPPMWFASRGTPSICRVTGIPSRGILFAIRAVINFSRGVINSCRETLKPCRETLIFCRVTLFSTGYAKSGAFTAKYAKYAKGNSAPVAIRKDFAYLAWFAVQCFPVFRSPTPIS